MTGVTKSLAELAKVSDKIKSGRVVTKPISSSDKNALLVKTGAISEVYFFDGRGFRLFNDDLVSLKISSNVLMSRYLAKHKRVVYVVKINDPDSVLLWK